MKSRNIKDKDYWENYYAKRKDPFEPSLFSQHVVQYTEAGKKLIELGCGNGRDAVSLSNNGLHVTAVDQCTNEVNYLAEKYDAKNLSFITGDFTKLPNGEKFDYVYSRFTLHSVDSSGEQAVYGWIDDNLTTGGYFFLEVRGRNNDLYGKGEKVEGEEHAFIYDDHYRRFLCIDEVKKTLTAKGYEILEAVEERGFSPFKGDDEVFIRLVAKKGA